MMMKLKFSNKRNNNDPNWGTTRAIIANTINGVTNGFTKH